MSLPRLKTLFPKKALAKPAPFGDSPIHKQAVATEVRVVYPNSSVEEQLFWEFLQTRGGYWQQQYTFGNIKERGSTRSDFFSKMLRAVIFLDGAYFHSKTVELDELKRSRVRQRHYRVFVFTFSSREDFDQHYKPWYFSNFTA